MGYTPRSSYMIKSNILKHAKARGGEMGLNQTIIPNSSLILEKFLNSQPGLQPRNTQPLNPYADTFKNRMKKNTSSARPSSVLNPKAVIFESQFKLKESQFKLKHWKGLEFGLSVTHSSHISMLSNTIFKLPVTTRQCSMGRENRLLNHQHAEMIIKTNDAGKSKEDRSKSIFHQPWVPIPPQKNTMNPFAESFMPKSALYRPIQYTGHIKKRVSNLEKRTTIPLNPNARIFNSILEDTSDHIF